MKRASGVASRGSRIRRGAGLHAQRRGAAPRRRRRSRGAAADRRPPVRGGFSHACAVAAGRFLLGRRRRRPARRRRGRRRHGASARDRRGRPLGRPRGGQRPHLRAGQPTAASGAGAATPTASSAAAIARRAPSPARSRCPRKAVDVRTALRVHLRAAGRRQRLVLGLQLGGPARARRHAPGRRSPGADPARQRRATGRSSLPGQGHGCGIRSPGRLYCWGRNTESQLGQGTHGAAADARARPGRRRRGLG